MSPTIDEALVAIQNPLSNSPLNIVPSSIRPLERQGVLNFLFRAELGDGVPCVIRTSLDPQRNGYRYLDKEIWVTEQLVRIGAPVPRLYSEVIPFAFRDKQDGGALYVAQFIEGTPASILTENNSNLLASVYRNLGILMRHVHDVQCTGFGSHFSAAESTFTHTWREAINEDAIKYGLTNEGIATELNDREILQYNSRLDELAERRFLGRLCHGDLNLSNLLVNPNDLSINALIDWERAHSALVPHSAFMIITYEMLVLRAAYSIEERKEVFEGDGILPELRSFLEGYGVTPAEYQQQYRHDVETLLLSKIAPFFSWWHSCKEVEARKRWQQAFERNQLLLRQLLHR